MPWSRDGYELEHQAAERWLWDSGQADAAYQSYREMRHRRLEMPTKVVAPAVPAWKLFEQFMGLPIEIDETITEPYVC